MTECRVKRQLLELSSSWLDQVSKIVFGYLILDLLEVPPALNIRQESAREQLVWAKDLQKVSFLPIQGDHGQSECSALRVDD